ncbi:fumarylacetoacetate hydrolase family protein [Ferrovibrio terrae]|uniref:Fumarylacetoacetate hydrolase family protein n=1 Tax=Ferrovibrio terrae TaxID=2594003 RepID=A0A516GZQ3_9PROT|nr:fumarylacetoacetate hydrolase family protein [Ferrovibrio terrae]QDO97008.1 fumarylacetoacetate hydrolase family protein [Ferrovibrio terrae]
MKLASFTVKGRESYGAVQGDKMVDLGQHFSGKHATLADFIGSSDFASRDKIIAGLKADLALNDVKLLPVIPRPEKIVCLVRNYMDHHQEVLAAGMHRELSEFPPIFLRVWRSQVAHGEPIIRPKVSEQLDWEGEMAVIIGKGGRHIAKEDAFNHIAGYACYNDASIREWQFHAKQIAAGKNFQGTGAFGPWMVTADEVPEPENLKLELRINGKTEQSSNTSNLIFKIPTIVNYCSTIFDLVPGDVLVTGTPAGVGWSRKPPQFMKHGDTVEVEIEKLGILRNPVVNEA